jgi:hypothetical protein
MWKRWIVTVVKKDWIEQAKVFLWFFAGFFAIRFIPASKLDDQGKLGVTVVVLFFASYLFPFSVLTMERRQHMLPMMLALPVSPLAIIIGKFVSVYSMLLLSFGVPWLVCMQDIHLLYLLTVASMTFATAAMMFSVFLEFGQASAIPMLFLLLILKAPALLQVFTVYRYQAAAVAAGLIPLMVAVSLWEFNRSARRSSQ